VPGGDHGDFGIAAMDVAAAPVFLVWATCYAGFFMGWLVLGAYCGRGTDRTATQKTRARGTPAMAGDRSSGISAGAVIFDAPNIVLDLKTLPLRDPDWYREAEIPVTKDGIVP
jgi:hypothetical protein